MIIVYQKFWTLKGILACLIVLMVLAEISSPSSAQVWFGYKESSYPAPVYKILESGDILIDDFESGSLEDNGWEDYSNRDYYNLRFIYPYPIIYPTEILWDSLKKSNVLSVEFYQSVFLLGTPWGSISKPIPSIDVRTHSNISFDLRLPLGFELDSDYFTFWVFGKNAADDKQIIVKIFALFQRDATYLGPVKTFRDPVSQDKCNCAVAQYDSNCITISVTPGGGMDYSSWHRVHVNLARAVKKAVDAFEEIPCPSDWYLDRIESFRICCNMYRLDNLMFTRTPSPPPPRHPVLFEMGPLYAQIFEPYRYLFMADCTGAGIVAHDVEGNKSECDRITDLMLNPANFIFAEDSNDPNDPVVKYWTDLGADPNLFGTDPDPVISDILDRDFIVDPNLPIFADPDLRLTASGPGPMAKHIISLGPLEWNATVNGSGENEIQAFLLAPLVVYPYDGMPTYIPVYYNALQVKKETGKPYFGPDMVYVLESALWNAGITVWPNIGALDYMPMYFEDLSVTLEVTDGHDADFITFTIEVVDKPVGNYAPVSQEGDETLTLYVGEAWEYVVNFIDPDCFVFSMAQPAMYTHTPGFPIDPENFRKDMDSLYWFLSPDSVSALNELIQDPPEDVTSTFYSSGLLKWTPKSTGIYETTIFCEDTWGATGSKKLTLVCTNRPKILDTWYYPYSWKPYFPILFNAYNNLSPYGGKGTALVLSGSSSAQIPSMFCPIVSMQPLVNIFSQTGSQDLLSAYPTFLWVGGSSPYANKAVISSYPNLSFWFAYYSTYRKS